MISGYIEGAEIRTNIPDESLEVTPDGAILAAPVQQR